MLKKIVLGTLFAAFVGILITGAVIRTTDKSIDTALEQEAGSGRGRSSSVDVIEEISSQGRGWSSSVDAIEEVSSQGRGRSSSVDVIEEVSSQGRGKSSSVDAIEEVSSQGRGQGGEGFAAIEEEQASSDRRYGNQTKEETDGLEVISNVEEIWETFTGVAVSVLEDEVTIELENGEETHVEGMPWAFAQEQGFTIQEGDTLILHGFFEDGEFKVGQMENLSADEVVTLRDAEGRPGWAGRGKRSA